MKASEVVKVLTACFKAKLPVLVKGEPGGGKTDLVHAAADAVDANLIISHPVVSDPTDFKGMPAITKTGAEFLPFGDLRKLIDAKTLTIAFADDLGQAPAVVQAAYMQLLLARRIGEHKVSDKVVFVAATNRREDKAGVTGILEPVKSRFCTIIELSRDLNEWSQWALANNVPAEVVAFNRWRPELFNSTLPPTNDLVNRPCPRTITNMAKLFTAGMDSLEVLSGAVGMAYATEFVGFLRVWRALPSIDAILINPTTASVPTEPSALFAVATALASRITADNAGRVMKYFCRLPQEYSVLGVRDGLRTCPAAANNKEFIKWASEAGNSEML